MTANPNVDDLHKAYQHLLVRLIKKPQSMVWNEEISFETQDGVTIQGWFIPADDKVIISNHFSPANRYGFAGHLEGLDFAGGFEVNFLPRYKALRCRL